MTSQDQRDQPSKALVVGLRSVVDRYKLLAFFLITFAITRGLLGLAHYLRTAPWGMVVGRRVHTLLYYGAAWGPALAALIVIALTQGVAGVRAFARRLQYWRVGVRWYAFALVGIPLLYLLAGLLTRAAGDSALGLSERPWSQVLLLTIFWGSGGPVEELGWRGFALPLLQQRFSGLAAAQIVGLIWGVWHLPDPVGLDLIAFVLQCVANSILLTVVYNGTGGSIPLACLGHWMMNLPYSWRGEAYTVPAQAVVLTAAAAVATLVARRYLGREHLQTEVTPGLAQRLPGKLGLAEDTARWAVDSSALALGRVSQPEPFPVLLAPDRRPQRAFSRGGSRTFRRALFAIGIILGLWGVFVGLESLYQWEAKLSSHEPVDWEAAELGEYLQLFMLPESQPNPSWDTGAEHGALPLKWIHEGVEDIRKVSPESGDEPYPFRRRGRAGIKVNGEVFWVKRGKRAVTWEIEMKGNRLRPEVVSIGPHMGCLVVSSTCAYNVVEMFKASGLKFQTVCQNRDYDGEIRGLYKIRAKGKRPAYVVYVENRGLKASSWLVLRWAAPGRTRDAMCNWLKD